MFRLIPPLSRFVPARSGTSVIPHKAIYLQPNRAVQRWYSIHGTGKLYFVPLCSGIVIELRSCIVRSLGKECSWPGTLRDRVAELIMRRFCFSAPKTLGYHSRG